MRAIKERRGAGGDVWHAAVGPRDPEALFQPIRCGGGIVFPGHIEQRPKADICRRCLADPGAGEVQP